MSGDEDRAPYGSLCSVLGLADREDVETPGDVQPSPSRRSRLRRRDRRGPFLPRSESGVGEIVALAVRRRAERICQGELHQMVGRRSKTWGCAS